MDTQQILSRQSLPARQQHSSITLRYLTEVWKRKTLGIREPPAMSDDDPRRAEMETQYRVALERVREVAVAGKQMLRTPAFQPKIIEIVDRLINQSKWPGADVIPDRAAYLEAMCQEVEDHGFCAGAVAVAVRRCAANYDWVPSIKQLLDECTSVTGELLLAIEIVERGSFAGALDYGEAERYRECSDWDAREKFQADLVRKRGRRYLASASRTIPEIAKLVSRKPQS